MNVKRISGNSEKNSVEFSYRKVRVTSYADTNGIISTKIKTIMDSSLWTGFLICFGAVIFNFLLWWNAGLLMMVMITLVGCLYYRFMDGSEQFRKMHGAEHMVANLLDCEKDISVDKLRKYSPICYRCGGTAIIHITAFTLIHSIFFINSKAAILIIPLACSAVWRFKENSILKFLLWPVYQASYFIQRHFTTLVPDDLQLEMASITANVLIKEIQKSQRG